MVWLTRHASQTLKPLGKAITEELTDKLPVGNDSIVCPVSVIGERLQSKLDYLPISTYIEFVVLITVSYLSYFV